MAVLRLIALHLAITVVSEATDYTMIVHNTNVTEAIEHKHMYISFNDDRFNPREVKTRVLGMLGLYNKGKTWVINNMFGVNLSSSYAKDGQTTGLSMFYLEEKKWLVVDTAGLQRPISSRAAHGDLSADCRHVPDGNKAEKDRCRFQVKKKRMQKDFVDSVHTERFVFDTVGHIADAIVFVVNDYTWYEQQELFSVLQKNHHRSRESTTHFMQTIVVAHVFKHLDSLPEAKKLFNQQIEQTVGDGNADADVDVNGALKYIEKYDFENSYNSGKPPNEQEVRHFAFGNAKYKEFKRLNDAGFADLLSYLDKKVEKVPTDVSTFAQKLEEATQDLLRKYAKCHQEKPREDMAIIVTYKEDFSPHKQAKLNFSPHNKSTKEDITDACDLVPVSEGVVDKMGKQLHEEDSFELTPPAIFEYGEGDHIYRVVTYDIPGVSSKDTHFMQHKNGIWQLSLDRKELPPHDFVTAAQDEKIVRKKGKPETKLPFGAGDFWYFDRDNKHVKIKDGVMTLTARYIVN